MYHRPTHCLIYLDSNVITFSTSIALLTSRVSNETSRGVTNFTWTENFLVFLRNFKISVRIHLGFSPREQARENTKERNSRRISFLELRSFVFSCARSLGDNPRWILTLILKFLWKTRKFSVQVKLVMPRLVSSLTRLVRRALVVLKVITLLSSKIKQYVGLWCIAKCENQSKN